MKCDLNKYAASVLAVGLCGAAAGFSETTAAASSSRHADAALPVQECPARFLGVGKLPMAVGSPAAALDGDQTTMWWSDTNPRQEFTVTFDAPWEVRSV